MSTFEERGITHLDLHGTKHIDVASEVLILLSISRPSTVNNYLWK